MDGYYAYNAARATSSSKEGYFASALSAGFPKNDHSRNAVLMRANIPPFRGNYRWVLQYADVLKLHGRSGLPLLLQCMEVIQRYASGDEIVNVAPPYYLAFKDMSPESLERWRKRTRNCRFQCWDCAVCRGA